MNKEGLVQFDPEVCPSDLYYSHHDAYDAEMSTDNDESNFESEKNTDRKTEASTSGFHIRRGRRLS